MCCNRDVLAFHELCFPVWLACLYESCFLLNEIEWEGHSFIYQKRKKGYMEAFFNNSVKTLFHTIIYARANLAAGMNKL